MNIICNLIYLAFPYIKLYKSNKIINGKINQLSNSEEPDLQYLSCYQELEQCKIEGLFKNTFEIKKTLEDKAKSNIIGLTISITLIMGLSSSLSNIENKTIHILLIIFSIYTIINMIIAGILSIATLVELNTVNELSPKELVNTDCLKEIYTLATELNVNRNILRNNYIYTSYECIRNAIFCLFFIFIIIVVPLPNSLTSKDIIQSNITIVNDYNIYYNSNVIDNTDNDLSEYCDYLTVAVNSNSFENNKQVIIVNLEVGISFKIIVDGYNIYVIDIIHETILY